MTEGLERYFRRKIAILEAEERRLHGHIDAAWGHATDGNASAAARELTDARWGMVDVAAFNQQYDLEASS